jgi:ubiquinone/menaquinone biosynthesis C-methylase UbiE
LKLPYENNSFDVCLVQAFMTILIDPKHRENILDETKRVLKNNGILYMSVF